MKTTSNFNGTTLNITIEGHVTGATEVMEIKNIVSAHLHATSVELNIKDAFVIPSALIGYLVKLVNGEKKRVAIQAKHEGLKNLLRDLNLHTLFEVR